MVERRDNVVTGPLGERMIRYLDRYPKADKIYVTSAMDGDHGRISHHYGLWYFADDDGFYVKDQIRYPGGSIYGKATMKDHRNHVHWATSETLMTLIERMTEPASAKEQTGAKTASAAPGLSATEHEELRELVRDLRRQAQRLEELVRTSRDPSMPRRRDEPAD